jgi:hypothetical protein
MEQTSSEPGPSPRQDSTESPEPQKDLKSII